MASSSSSSSGGLICMKEAARRSYELKINYSESMSISPGCYLKTPIFSVGGYDWQLFYLTNWKCSANRSQGVSVLFYISLRTVARNVNATFDLTLVKNNGSLSTTKTRRVSQVFSNNSFPSQARDDSVRWVQFLLPMDELEHYLLEGHIIATCAVTVISSDSNNQEASSARASG